MPLSDNVDFFLDASERAGLPDSGIIGYAFGRGVRQLGREAALDAAIAGYVYAVAAHDPQRGPFQPLAFTATEMERRRELKRRTRYGYRFNRAAEGDWDYATFRARGPSPVDEAERRDLVAFVFRCVARLRPEHRAAIEAVHVRGITLVAHSKEIGRSHMTANNRYHRAIAKLKGMMRHA